MIKILRKRHLQIWILWAVLLPIGILVAWRAVPKKITEQLLQPEQVEILPIYIETQARKGEYFSTLNTNRERSKYQLQWQIYRESEYSSSNIYRSKSLLIYYVSKSNYELLGRIGGKQAYYFNLPIDSSDSYSFIIYDPFRKKRIDSISFNKISK